MKHLVLQINKKSFSWHSFLLESHFAFFILHFSFAARRAVSILASIILSCVVFAPGRALAQADPFEVATVHFEQNATDGDVEVVFEVKAGDDGMAKLTVVSPDGRTVMDFTAPDPSTMGIRQFRFESPEPRDVNALKAAYPAGVYEFSASTADGQQFESKSTLNHTLPATVSDLKPDDGAEDVGIENLEISWNAVKGVRFYAIEISQEDLGISVSAKLPSSATSFHVPDGFLLPGKTFKIGLGTVTKEGNTSVVEVEFTTSNTQ